MGSSPIPGTFIFGYDVLCEWEAIAREAMLQWAVHEAHDILSLQHDGIVFALRPDMG